MLSVTDVRLCHIDAIEVIEKQCFSMPWTRDMLIKQASGDMYIFLAAENESGEAVGYIGLMYVLDEGYISNIAVSPDWRRRGVGDMLIDELIIRAKEKELSFVTLEVRESNLAAIGLYKKHGFSEVGRRRNYYEQPRENAILMTRFLDEEE